MINNLKVGLISSVISSKNGFHLAKHLADKDEVAELFLYTEKSSDELLTEKLSNKLVLIPCWKFNSANNLFGILKKIRSCNPHIVIINFEPSLTGNRKPAIYSIFLLPVLLKIFGFKSFVLLNDALKESDLNKRWVNNFLTQLLLKANMIGVTKERQVNQLRNISHKKNVVLIPQIVLENPQKDTINLNDLADWCLLYFEKILNEENPTNKN